MALNLQVFTNAGISMLGQADAGATLTITRIVIGSGTAAQDSDLYPLTALINWQEDVTITRKQDLGGGIMLVSGVINEWDMPAGPPFQLRELGIMAYTTGAQTQKTPPGGTRAIGPAPPAPLVQPPQPKTTDSLYCVSNVYHDAPQTVTPGGTNSWAFDIQVQIDRAASVVIQIGQVTTYDCENVPTDDLVDPGWYAGRAGNVFQFKRAVAGTGIALDSTTYPDRIIIATKRLAQNVDLYVPANNPDAGPSPPPNTVFASIQAAHDYLLTFSIPADKTATIHVHELNNAVMLGPPISITHPNSSQIYIVGQPRIDKSVTKIQWVSNTQKDVFCTDVTGLVAGQYVYIALSAGYGGGCQIASVNTVAKSVRVNIWNANLGVPYSATDNNANRLSRLPTQIRLSPDPTGGLTYNIAAANGIGGITNICLIGHSNPNLAVNGDFNPYLSYAFSINNSGNLTNCMAVNARRGVSVGSGNVFMAGECIFANCGFGVTGIGTVAAYGANPNGSYIYLNGCGQAITPSPSGFAIGSIIAGDTDTEVWLNHNTYGINAGGGGTFDGGTIWMINNWRGVQCTSHSICNLGNGGYQLGVYPIGNTQDIYVQGVSYVFWDRGSFPAPPNCSPTPDTFQTTTPFNNQLGFIHIVNSTSLGMGTTEAAAAGAPFGAVAREADPSEFKFAKRAALMSGMPVESSE